MLASAPIIQALIGALAARYTLPTTTTASVSTGVKSLPLLPPMIIDPVSVSTSRHSLLSTSAIHDLVFDFLPLCRLVTPNALEAGMIANCLRASADGPSIALKKEALGRVIKETEEDNGVKVDDLRSMVDVGREILRFLHGRRMEGERGVLVKGGHVPLTRSALKEQLASLKETSGSDLLLDVVWNGNSLEADLEDEGFVEILAAYRETLQSGSPSQASPTATKEEANNEVLSSTSQCIVDVLLTSSEQEETMVVTLFVAPSVKSRSTHGTGCTLSAAIASNVGHGKSRE